MVVAIVFSTKPTLIRAVINGLWEGEGNLSRWWEASKTQVAKKLEGISRSQYAPMHSYHCNLLSSMILHNQLITA